MMNREEQNRLHKLLNSAPKIDEIEPVLTDDEIFQLRFELDAVAARRRELNTAALLAAHEPAAAVGWK